MTQQQQRRTTPPPFRDTAAAAATPGKPATRAEPVDLRLMGRGDAGRVLAFTQALPAHDLLFLRRDVTRPEQVERWLRQIEQGQLVTVLAVRDGEVLGYATIDRGEVSWTRHVGELRVLVAHDHRGMGLGRRLTEMAFDLALDQGIEKMIAQMTPDQRGAISVFERMGFRPEALLVDHVQDRSGERHDLLIMSQRVGEFRPHPARSALEQALERYGTSG